MRKGVWNLCGLVPVWPAKSNPLDGSVYVFFSKSYQTVKLLVWDRDGFVVYMKRLEQGRFESLSKIERGIKIQYQVSTSCNVIERDIACWGKTKLRYNLNQTAIGHKFYWKIYAHIYEILHVFLYIYTVNIKALIAKNLAQRKSDRITKGLL